MINKNLSSFFVAKQWEEKQDDDKLLFIVIFYN